MPPHEERYAEALRQVKERLEGRRAADGEVFERVRVDVRALRERYGLTQQAFADRFGIALGTLRNWEQGRREPDGPATLLLQIIERRPDMAQEVFGASPLVAEKSIATPTAKAGRFEPTVDSIVAPEEPEFDTADLSRFKIRTRFYSTLMTANPTTAKRVKLQSTINRRIQAFTAARTG
jgi:putative transcriptional regulator